MRFFDCKTAPSPRRARIFIAEKGLDIETVEIDLGKGEQLSDDFRRINPRCTVPVLELDDGTCLTENAGIAAYLEAIAPAAPLLGTSAEEKGSVANWNARIELEGLWPLADALRNRSKGMVGRAITGPTDYQQIPELAERGLARAAEFFEMLNDRLGHAAGDELLAGIAKTLDESVRETDFLARYGGEEFVVLCPDTDLAGAVTVAEKVRSAIAESSFILDGTSQLSKVTISIGVAQFEGSRRSFFKAADQALYRAKGAGKNCVKAARELPDYPDV